MEGLVLPLQLASKQHEQAECDDAVRPEVVEHAKEFVDSVHASRRYTTEAHQQPLQPSIFQNWDEVHKFNSKCQNRDTNTVRVYCS